MLLKHKLSIGAFLAICAASAAPTSSFVIDNWWDDGDDIVMDDVFLPAATFSAPAQNQLAEWNQVDVTTNDHPFLISGSPSFFFGADDGDNTMGFLGEAGLNSEYGLSYASALAWTVCWSSWWTGDIVECDMMLDPSLPWSLGPDDDEWFQSTVLHEAGHIRGLDHFNSFLSMQNSGVNKKLRAETLYMDDKVAVRQHASHVNENDMTIYPKFHNGSSPMWMTSPSPTTLREGDLIQWNDITVENRGTNALGGNLRVGFFSSTNSTISTGDTLLNTGSWGSFGHFTFSTFDWSATVPTVSDCGTRFFGGIIDDNNAWSERFEGNNATAFHDGGPDPQAYTIKLRRDFLEPNDSFAGARAVTMPLNANLSIDQDLESDYYRFNVGNFTNINATISFTHATGDVDLQLLNSAGTVIASSTGVTNTESVSASWLWAGTYYLRVYGYGGGSCNRYSINASTSSGLIIVDRLP